MKFKTNINTKGGQWRLLSLQKMLFLQLQGGCTLNPPGAAWPTIIPHVLSALLAAQHLIRPRCTGGRLGFWPSTSKPLSSSFPKAFVRHIIASDSCHVIREGNIMPFFSLSTVGKKPTLEDLFQPSNVLVTYVGHYVTRHSSPKNKSDLSYCSRLIFSNGMLYYLTQL